MLEVLLSIIILAVGIIIGLLINPVKETVIEVIKEVKEDVFRGKTQFISPIDLEEDFKNADNFKDVLKNE